LYSNIYGTEGVKHLIDLMRAEIIADAGNLGIGDLSKINPSSVSYTNLIPKTIRD